jgi:hypothetical protein
MNEDMTMKYGRLFVFRAKTSCPSPITHLPKRVIVNITSSALIRNCIATDFTNSIISDNQYLITAPV